MSSVQIFYPEWTRETLTEVLREGVFRLNEVLPVERAVLFGSWSRARATVRSDIDVLIVYRGEARSDAYGLAWRALGVRGLELHLYSEDEAERIVQTIEQMTRESISLLRVV